MSSSKEKTAKVGSKFIIINILEKSLLFLFILLVSRTLGPENFGILALCLSVAGVAQALGTFGLPITIQRFLSGQGEKDAGELFGTIIVMGISTAIITSIGLFLLAPWLGENLFSKSNLVIPLRLFCIIVFLTILYSLLRALLQSQLKARSIMWGDLTKQGGKIIIFLIFAVVSPTVLTATWAIILSTFFAVIIAGNYVIKYFHKPDFRNIREKGSKVLAYSAPLVIVGFSYFFAQQADRLMLGFFSTSRDVGLYSVASTLALLLGVLHASLVSVFMPIASESFRKKKPDDMHDSYLFISKWVGFINGIILLIYMGCGTLILNVFGAEYATTSNYCVLVILAFLYYIGSIAGPTGALLLMGNKQNLELMNALLFLIMNISLNILLIPKFNIIGAAIASLCSGVFFNIIQLIEIKILFNFIPFTKIQFRMLLFMLISSLLLILLDSIIIKMVIVFIIIVMFSFFIIRKMDSDEKKMLLLFKKRWRY